MYKFIDLFSGMGGFRLAFESVGCKCVFSSEIDKYAIKTYKLNYGVEPAGDITKINAKDIPNHDILCAGFPCQAFSIAGKRKGFKDARGTLFFDVARILKEKKPKIAFLENVKGITNHDGGKTLKTILSVLDDVGYDYKFMVLNAKNYGLPQSRERWYCVCVRKNLKYLINDFEFPEKIKKIRTINDILEKGVSYEYKVSDRCKENINNNIQKKGVKVDNVTIAYEVRPSKCQFKTDGIAPTLTAKMGTGGNNIPVLIKDMRFLTERECLNIMGYPKTFKYEKGSHTYKQIGNSVCVPVVTKIAKQVVKLLDN